MLEILVGPIASGKSTYCREAAKEGAIILNDDSIITAIHGGDYKLYRKNLKPLYKSIENTAISTALAMGLRVVVDRPNHSRRMRRRYIGLGHSFDVPVRLVIFQRESPEVHASRRFNGDSRGHSLDYWVSVAKAHDALYEVPEQSTEQYDELVVVEWCPPGHLVKRSQS